MCLSMICLLFYDLVRGGRWPALKKTVTKCQSLLKKYQGRIIQELPNNKHFFLFISASHPDVPKHDATIFAFLINSMPG